MNQGWKSYTKAVISFFTLFMAGYLVIFNFQNCSRARLGIQGVSTKVDGLDVNGPQDVAPSCAGSTVAIGLNSSGVPLCVNPSSINGTRLCGQNEYIYQEVSGSVRCISIADRDPSGVLCPYNQQMTSYVDSITITCAQMPGATESCPPGEWLRGFDSAGVKVCSGGGSTGTPTPTPTPAPTGTPSTSPTPGATPTPSATPTPTGTPAGPTNVSCPAGQYLDSIVNGVAVCQPILPTVAPMNSCPDGQAVVGQTATGLHCQNLMPISPTDVLCVGGMYLKDYSNGAVNCVALPTKDYAHYCGDGKYLKTINTQGFLCEDIPTNLLRYNGTCAPGFYLQGFENGAAKCLPVSTTPSYNANCPRGFYASAISNGVLICVSHQNGGLLCNPGSQRTCAVPFGAGAQTCAPDGKSWGSCLPTTCNAGYELNGLACVPSNCPVGYVKENGQCVDKTPPTVQFSVLPAPVTESRNAKFVSTVTDLGSGVDTVLCRVDAAEFVNCTPTIEFQIATLGVHKFELKATDKTGNSTLVSYTWTVVALPPVCQPGGKIVCIIGNAHGYQYCKADGSGFTACLPNSCPVGYEMKNGCCVLSSCTTCTPTCTPGAVAQCEIPNGVGQTFCKQDGKGFGPCIPKSCNTGWVLQNGACVRGTNPTPSPTPSPTPRPTATPAPAQWGWINTNGSESHQQACSRAGAQPATGNGMSGLGICAADESAPGPGSGLNWEKIVYPNNLKHLSKNITYKQIQGGTIITKSRNTYFCYKPGQKKDNDKTDRVAAYLCKLP